MKTHLTKAILILLMAVAAVPSLAQQRGTVSFSYDANGNRTAQQIETNGDRRHAESETCISPDEENLQLPAISLYPNPTKGTVNILIDRNAVGKPVQMTITTVSGSVIIEKPITLPLETIDLSNHAVGTYFVRLVVDGETYIGKITKE